MSRLAKTISVLLHPLFMPFYATALLLYATPFDLFVGSKAAFFILGIVLFLTCFTPFLFVLILHKLGAITSLSIKDKRERGIPLLFGALMCYICYVFLLRIIRLDPLFSQMFFSLTVFLLILVFITKFWKISLHMSAIGGLLAMILLFSYQEWLLVGVILIAGLLGTSRLWLKAHNSLQVYAGFLLGLSYFLICFV